MNSNKSKYKKVTKARNIINENFTHKNVKSNNRKKLLEMQFKMYKLLYDEVKNEIKKIYKIADESNEEIELLEIQNNSYEISTLLLQTEVEAIAEKMFEALSKTTRKLAGMTYKKVYETLIQEWSEISSGKQKDSITQENLIENELYDNIELWLDSFKRQFFEDINLVFDDSFLGAKDYIQKGFFEDLFENLKETFSKAKEKIDSIVRNTVLNAQTTAQKIAFKVQRVERYQIVLSENPKTCDKCREMADEHFNIADLEVGETAPPFHPNCGCTMIPYISAEKDGSLWEQLVIAFNVAFELLAQIGPSEKLIPPFYNFVKSAIWAAGNFYLVNIKKLPLAGEMFRLGMYGEGKGMSEKATALIIEAMKNSKKLNDEIFKLTQSSQNFDTGRFNFGFEKEMDEDLYYAVQNVNMRIIGANLGNNTWKIRVISWDDYDFTEFRNSLEFADLANNLGEAMQRNNMMKPYSTLTEYECLWQRE